MSKRLIKTGCKAVLNVVVVTTHMNQTAQLTIIIQEVNMLNTIIAITIRDVIALVRH
jgi:hypothetical protein